jgi:hypothetical protein
MRMVVFLLILNHLCRIPTRVCLAILAFYLSAQKHIYKGRRREREKVRERDHSLRKGRKFTLDRELRVETRQKSKGIFVFV